MTKTFTLTTLTDDQDEEIEHLLLENYRWQIRQSHVETLRHFYKPEDRTCRDYTTPSSLDDDEENDDVYRWADDRQAEQVQLCIDALPLEQRAAISISIRNKESGHAVWKSGRAGEQHENYQDAKRRLLPMLENRQIMRRKTAA
jgi:hypothetical protein